MSADQIMEAWFNLEPYLETAEREIARAQRKYGLELVHGFKVLCPSPVLRGKAPRVYRSHCRELLRRVARGQDTRPPTRAELLCAVSDASLVAPFNQAGAAAYEYLSRRVMGPTAYKKVLGDVPPAREPWPGAIGELLRPLRKKLMVPDRKTV